MTAARCRSAKRAARGAPLVLGARRRAGARIAWRRSSRRGSRRRNPVVLAVMHGGAFAALELCKRFAFPHEFDYVHVTRYRGRTRGGDDRSGACGRQVARRPDRARRRRHPRSRQHAARARDGARARRRREALERGARREATRAPRERPARRPSAGSPSTTSTCSAAAWTTAATGAALRGIYALAEQRRVTGLALIVGSGFEQLGFEVADAQPDEDAVRRAEQRRAHRADRRRAGRVHRAARRGRTRWRRTRSTTARTSGRSSNAACAPASASTPSARSTPGFVPGELAVPDQLIDYTHGRAVDVRRRRRARAAHRVHGAVRAAAARARRGGDRGLRLRAFVPASMASPKGRGSRPRPRSTGWRATAARWSA